jgi:hypothetical protein
MNEELVEGQALSRWEQHRFMLLVGLTIVVSLFLVGVSLALYASSGAAQLDLSRPGYVSVRDQAVRADTFNGFPDNGAIDKSTIDQFRSLYDKQAERASNVDSFSGNAMSEDVLGIDAPAEPAQ